MKMIKLPFLLPVLAALIVALALKTNLVDAKSYNNCQNAQIFIGQTLKKSDLRSRVDRLQLYQAMYNNIQALSTRLTTNNQPGASKMAKSVLLLSREIDQFKTDYESYDTARNNLADLPNCQSDTSSFKKRLLKARAARVVVETDSQQIRQRLGGDISDQMADIHSKLQQKNGTN